MRNTARFLWQFCRHPAQTGALAPSGRWLAKQIVEAIGPVEPGKLIIELGPGTGVFTRAIRAQLPDNRVLVIERNDRFAAGLRRQFPDIHVAETCASELASSLRTFGHDPEEVGGVISGLPLLSLPPPLVRKIFAGLANVLPPGSRFANFTYSKRTFLKKIETPGFRVVETRRVWRNLPPASIMVMQHLGSDELSHAA